MHDELQIAALPFERTVPFPLMVTETVGLRASDTLTEISAFKVMSQALEALAHPGTFQLST